MQPRRLLVILAVLTPSLLVRCQSTGKVTFQDSDPGHETEKEGDTRATFVHAISGNVGADVSSSSSSSSPSQQRGFNPVRHVEDLFRYIGLGTGRNVDPYLAKINERCLTGDLAECFKSRALNYLSDFFDHAEYTLSDYVRVKRMSGRVVAEVHGQQYEYSHEPRSSETEWDQMVNFMKRKLERFVKTMSFELTIPDSETGRSGAYEARFLDEIADEIDVLEDKKDTLFSRNQLRKLFIPMLLVLKLFKLKLLLFLPLILGLASFKKFLGFLVILIPGLIGFFKLYKPYQNSYPPIYTKNGIGHPHYETPAEPEYHEDHYGSTSSYGQNLAYRGYQHYNS